MTNLTFSQNLAQQYFQSAEQFPIDFDDAWVWLGYSTKQKAEQSLYGYFEEGLDFLTSGLKTSTGGRPSKLILLSVECFKQLGMLAKTEQGKVIRKYFLECERIAKELSKQQPAPQIPGDIRAVNFINMLASQLGCDVKNPRFNQELQDFCLDIAIGYKRIASSEPKEVWLGVAERAEQLGYPISLVTNNRSQLGKYVATFGLQSTKENRLCNGTQRPINLYLLSDELDNAIKEFMDAKMLAV
jgi:phage anti-repressor protein